MSDRTHKHWQPKPHAMLERARQQLAAGDGLAAQRTARAAEQILALETRLQRQAAAAEHLRHAAQMRALDARRRDLDARHAALNQREVDLACEAQRLEELKQGLEALYAELYNKEPAE